MSWRVLFLAHGNCQSTVGSAQQSQFGQEIRRMFPRTGRPLHMFCIMRGTKQVLAREIDGTIDRQSNRLQVRKRTYRGAERESTHKLTRRATEDPKKMKWWRAGEGRAEKEEVSRW